MQALTICLTRDTCSWWHMKTTKASAFCWVQTNVCGMEPLHHFLHRATSVNHITEKNIGRCCSYFEVLDSWARNLQLARQEFTNLAEFVEAIMLNYTITLRLIKFSWWMANYKSLEGPAPLKKRTGNSLCKKSSKSWGRWREESHWPIVFQFLPLNFCTAATRNLSCSYQIVM